LDLECLEYGMAGPVCFFAGWRSQVFRARAALSWEPCHFAITGTWRDVADQQRISSSDRYEGTLADPAEICSLDEGRHPITFYRKLGFEVVGLFQNVSGFGKPDILMAKRLSAPASGATVRA